MGAKKYIVAVSGGVDSVVLLHKLVSKSETYSPSLSLFSPPVFIVAHFDHGIRPDSATDAEFVKRLAKNYGLKCIVERAELGPGASEAEARSARYEFLRRTMGAQGAEAIITAHHEDDVLETMIINIVRRGGPRALVGFTAPNIVRPLLSQSKATLLSYARLHNLSWREDSTNEDTTYLRNYVRIKLLPKLGSQDRKRLLGIRAEIVDKYHEIDILTRHLLVSITNKQGILRVKFVVLPYLVQKEIMATWLRLHAVTISREMVERATLAAKTLRPYKHIELAKGVELHSTKDRLLLTIHTHRV